MTTSRSGRGTTCRKGREKPWAHQEGLPLRQGVIERGAVDGAVLLVRDEERRYVRPGGGVLNAEGLKSGAARPAFRGAPPSKTDADIHAAVAQVLRVGAPLAPEADDVDTLPAEGVRADVVFEEKLH